MTCKDLAEIDPGLGSLFNGMVRAGKSYATVMDGPILTGRVEIHNPRRGVYLYILDVCADRDIKVAMNRERPMVVLSLVLSGTSRHRIQRLNNRESVVEFKPGENVIGSFKAERSRFDISGGQYHKMVDLHIDPAEAQDLIASNESTVSGPLYSIFSQTDGTRLSLQCSLTQYLEEIAQQILNCRFQGVSRQLFMESKALEILALELDTFSRTATSRNNYSKEDLRCLEMARHILQAEFNNPPSLVDLARRVGFNDFKLKRGFRQIYNTTVFGYVRRLRMEKARSLLETGEANVTQAAMATGYNCIGHFSAAFKKHFGRLPSHVRRGGSK